MQRSLTLVLVAGIAFIETTLMCCAAADAYAPNHFLGTCFDDAWVAQVEADPEISRDVRDDKGRLVHPHLHAALSAARFQVNDPRTALATSKLYRDDCKSPDSVIYGVGAKVDETGKVIDSGRVNGSLVVELKGWESSTLTTMVFSILAQELLGYDISFYRVDNVDEMAQRMSSTGAGVCTPVHVNVEVAADSKVAKKYAIYSDESYSSGSIGYTGRAGLYTTTAFIRDGVNSTKRSTTFAADFWRDYQKVEDLIKSFPVSALKANAKYYPPKVVTCTDGTLGCVDSCSKTAACYAREALGKECIAIAMMTSSQSPGYLQAVLENRDIAAQFCFLGTNELEAYAVEMQVAGKPVLFYHFEPDPFHTKNAGKFERISLPRATPAKALLASDAFGDNGPGKKTSNPVRVDFQFLSMQKYAATLTQDLPLVNTLITRMALNDVQLGEVQQLGLNVTSAVPAAPHPTFVAACTWLRGNYEIWRLWLGRLPLCNVFEYLAHDFVGCNDSSSSAAGATETAFPREVRSRWLVPNPTNASLPHNCDGGVLTPPAPIVTSKSCAWLAENRQIWIFWLTAGKPVCDPTYYTYDVSQCEHAHSKREVSYRWLLPDATNATKSAECQCRDGVTLPPSVLLECGYVPHTDPRFVAVAALAAVLASVFFVAMCFVYYHRKQPIIKRSQYQFLLVLLFGGIVVCGSALSYAGAPTNVLCTTRATSVTFGFTLIFGALVVKSLRVYRVFMSGTMKRIVLSAGTMFKILAGFLLIDLAIIVAWNIIDPPKSTVIDVATPEIGGGIVKQLQCTSSSFVFTALLIFWKAVLLFAGLYLSFLIRKVSSDFQESVWIFASALVVLFTSVIILALAYLVELPAITFYVFASVLQLGATAIVVALMIVPKILRLHESATESQNASSSNGSSSAHNRNSSRTSSASVATMAPRAPAKSPTKLSGGEMKSIIPGFLASSMNSNSRTDSKQVKKSKNQVTPIHQFKINDE